MLTIVVYHSKGGVGKTTLSGLLAQFMAGLGYAGAISRLYLLFQNAVVINPGPMIMGFDFVRFKTGSTFLP